MIDDHITFFAFLINFFVQIIEAMRLCLFNRKKSLLFWWPILDIKMRIRASNFDLIFWLNARVIHSDKYCLPFTIGYPLASVIPSLIYDMITYLYVPLTFQSHSPHPPINHFLQLLVVLINLIRHLSVIVLVHSFLRRACNRVMMRH